MADAKRSVKAEGFLNTPLFSIRGLAIICPHDSLRVYNEDELQAIKLQFER
jgi:hypothetical protein